MISGILHVLRNGLRWRDAPACYGPYKTLYNRFVRWSAAGVFARLFTALAAERDERGLVMLDSTHITAHRTAASLQKKGVLPRAIGRTRGGLTSKLHAVCDGEGKPVTFLLTAGQVSDIRGAEHLLPTLPAAKTLLADKGYDSDRFRAALRHRDITPCIPGRAHRKKTDWPTTPTCTSTATALNACSVASRDWRCIATRYDRCAHTFFSAICLAATMLFWL